MKTYRTRLLLLAPVFLAASCAAVESGTAPSLRDGRDLPKAAAAPRAEDPPAGRWTRFSDPGLEAVTREALRLAPETDRGISGVRRDPSARAAKAYFAVAEGQRQVAVARAVVQNRSRALAEVRLGCASGRCGPDDVASVSKDLTWANNVFRQQREQLGFEVRRLERLLGRALSRESLLEIRLPDLPEDVSTGDGLADREARCNAALDRAADRRRKAEEGVAQKTLDIRALLDAERDELEAQSRWISLRMERLNCAVDRLKSSGDPAKTPAGPGAPWAVVLR